MAVSFPSSSVFARRRRRDRILDRWQARRAGQWRGETRFAHLPDPRLFGYASAGAHMVQGQLLLAGHLVQIDPEALWDCAPPDRVFANELHGFGWLDDLAALGDAQARAMGSVAVAQWIARFGRGRGPGWTAALVGRRVLRWLSQGQELIRGQPKDATDAFLCSLAQQVIFLAKRHRSSAPGLPRIETLSGLILGALHLDGFEKHAPLGLAALGRDCAVLHKAGGTVESRNPEELMEILNLLTWVREAARRSGLDVPAALNEAIVAAAPVLRLLRHGDGALARFHGGGRGAEGRLDQALSEARPLTPAPSGLQMGYARIQAGRNLVLMDAAPPATGPGSVMAHASTLAFELSSGRRPLVVSCGPGAFFGLRWHRAARHTASHSVLVIDDISSARLQEGRELSNDIPAPVIEVPSSVPWGVQRLTDAQRLEAAHDGYRKSHGLTHARLLDLTLDGRALIGEDVLSAMDAADKGVFARSLAAASERADAPGLPFALRFHLHPDVQAELDIDEQMIALTLPSGEEWMFRVEGSVELALEPSVYLEEGRLRPRDADQIVLSGRATSYETRIRWAFGKAQSTPDAQRDLVPDDPAAPDPEEAP